MGNDEYEQKRLGAFVEIKNVGPLNVTFSGGYADVDGTQGDSGAYGSVGVSTAF